MTKYILNQLPKLLFDLILSSFSFIAYLIKAEAEKPIYPYILLF